MLTWPMCVMKRTCGVLGSNKVSKQKKPHILYTYTSSQIKYKLRYLKALLTTWIGKDSYTVTHARVRVELLMPTHPTSECLRERRSLAEKACHRTSTPSSYPLSGPHLYTGRTSLQPTVINTAQEVFCPLPLLLKSRFSSA